MYASIRILQLLFFKINEFFSGNVERTVIWQEIVRNPTLAGTCILLRFLVAKLLCNSLRSSVTHKLGWEKTLLPGSI